MGEEIKAGNSEMACLGEKKRISQKLVHLYIWSSG